MKKTLCVLLMLLLPLSVFGATVNYQVNFNWDLKDTTGITEASFPVIAEVAINGTTLTTPILTIPVGTTSTSFVISPIALTKVNNASTVYKTKVRLKDAAGNISAWSDEASVTIVGDDTNPPSKPTTFQMILAWFKRIFGRTA